MNDITQYLRIEKPPQPSSGTMIIALAGLHDPTGVTTQAVRHIADSLRTSQFAGLEPDEFYFFNQTGPLSEGTVEENNIRVTWPGTGFHQVPEDRGPSPVLMIGQRPALRLQAMGRAIIHVAKLTNVSTIINLTALPMHHPHTAPPDLRGFATRAKDAQRLGIAGTAQPGMGIDDPAILEACIQAGLGYIVVSGRVPNYLNLYPNPMTSIQIADHINQRLGLELDLEKLRKEANGIREQIDQSMREHPLFAQHVENMEDQRQQHIGAAGQLQDIAQTLRSGNPGQLDGLDPGSVAREVDNFLRSQIVDGE